MVNFEYKRIQGFSGDLDGVFTLPDLKVALDKNTEISLFRSIKKLQEAGELIKIKRGVYAAPDASLETISARIAPKSYISTDSVLAAKAIIGSIPARKVQAIKVGRPRVYKCSLGVIEHLSISPSLFFGFESIDGRLYATPEKAFLDVCYYCFKGKRLSFDPATDINIEQLNMNIVEDYLKKYDKRFVSFFNRIWGPLS